MARRTPAEVLSAYASNLSINDHANPSTASSLREPPSPVINYRPTMQRAARGSVSTTASAMTDATDDNDADRLAAARNFLLADMDGRAVRDNVACYSCASNLADEQLGQVTWHLAEGECRLCQVASVKPEAFTKPFCDFISENPTVFHTVDYFKKKLSAAGYKELSARDNWSGVVRPGGKYYISRNGSSMLAFNVGKEYKPGNGIAFIGGHIDAVTAKLKPVSKKPVKAGYHQLGVAPYSTSLSELWWDRDLCIGGKVVVVDKDTNKTSTKLVKIDWPIAKVPSLAVHFGKGLLGQQNKETQAVPVIGLANASDAAEQPLGPEGSFVNNQPSKLVKIIAKQLGITHYDSIKDWELELYDGQPAQLIGLDRDMISAGRIDDKLCSWPAMMALIASEDTENDCCIKLVGVFDDEEVGSKLRQGAASNFVPTVVERTIEAISGGSVGPGVLGQTWARSFILSADVSHAGNPNFLDQYLPEHIPELNTGMVVSADSNAHFITDSESTTVLKRIANLAGAKTQTFMIRNDSRSGGTIGPYLACLLGARGADCGLPQLSMHSIRATTGSLDPGLGVQFFKAFLDNWQKIDDEWEH